MNLTYFIFTAPLIKRTPALLVMYPYFASNILAKSYALNNVDLFGPRQQFISSEESRYAAIFSAWRHAVRTTIFVFRQPVS